MNAYHPIVLVLALAAACEHPSKHEREPSPRPPPQPPKLGGIRGLVTGGGWSPNAMGSPSRWLEKGAIADMSVAIDDAILKTDDEGRYDRMLPAGTYAVRVLGTQCRRVPGDEEETVVVDVKPGHYVDVVWRCSFIYF